MSFYRLLGPFKDRRMKEIVEGELMDSVKRRGWAGNFFFGLLPMVFYGMVNGMALLLEVAGIVPGQKVDVRVVGATEGLEYLEHE